MIPRCWVVSCTVLLGLSREARPQNDVRQLRVTAPSVTIGREGDPKYEFTRVMQAAELGSGQLVVVDQGRNELRIFDRKGVFERALGRTGAGPGEFRHISSLMRSGDTLIVWDGILRRLTRYTADGTLGSTTPITVRASQHRAHIVGALPGGTWLVNSLITPVIMRPPGIYLDSVPFGVLRGDSLTWLGAPPGPLLYVYNPVRTASRGEAVGGAAFSAWPQAQSLGDVILLLDGTNGNAPLLNPSGQRVGSIPIPLEPQRITTAHARKALAAEIERVMSPTGRAFTEAKYADDVLPKLSPRYDAFVKGIGDEFWLQEYPLDPDAPTRFVGLRRDGSSVGQFSLPARARLLHIGRDFIWNVTVDDDGVERLERRPLVR